MRSLVIRTTRSAPRAAGAVTTRRDAAHVNNNNNDDEDVKTLPFGLDAQPAASCSGTRSEVTEVITTVRRGVKHEARGPNPARHVTLSGP